MSDSLLTILEMIEEELARSVQIPISTTQDGEEIGYMKTKNKAKEVSSGFLDVKRIVDAIVSTTESETAEKDQSIADSFEIIRRFNQEKINNINNAQTLNDAIVSFYQNTSGKLSPDCRDFSTIAKRALINAAYSKILNDFNASAAGFVNEAYLANLLGNSAQTVPAGGSKIDGGTGKLYNNIADLEFNNVGISLKTKKGGVSGSIRDLLATLGIPFKIGSNVSMVSEPRYESLYYVFFGKNQSSKGYFDISTAKITPQAVLKYIRGKRFGSVRKGVLVMTPEKATKLEKTTDFLLGATRQYKNFNKGIGGVGEFANKQLEFKPSQEFNAQQAEKLGKELTTTLNTLNGYISQIEKTIVQYAANPTVGNLQTLQQSLQMLSDFQIASLISC